MVVFSSLSRYFMPISTKLNGFQRPVHHANILRNVIQIRNMSDHGPRTLAIQTSRFQWQKFKDLLHFYSMIGILPIAAIIFYANVFVGPATLTEIPDDYIPKHWEYHRHPISRFLARYVYPPPQQDYEKMCHYLFEENEKKDLRLLEAKVKAKMAERSDYQAYYYRPAVGKYHRISKETTEYLQSIWGD